MLERMSRFGIVFVFFVFTIGLHAQSQAGFQDSLIQFFPIIILFAIFYFLIIRPQSKRMKEHKNMIEKLSIGDSVVVAGGIVSEISEIQNPFLSVLIAKDLTIQVQKESVTMVLPKGTVKFKDQSEKKA